MVAVICPVKKGLGVPVLVHGLQDAESLTRALVMVSEMRLGGAHKAKLSVELRDCIRIGARSRR